MSCDRADLYMATDRISAVQDIFTTVAADFGNIQSSDTQSVFSMYLSVSTRTVVLTGPFFRLGPPVIKNTGQTWLALLSVPITRSSGPSS